EMPDANTATGIALRLVLQRGAELGRRHVALGLVEELEAVTVGIEKAVGATVTEVALVPAARRAARLERDNATVECRGAVRAVGEVADAGLGRVRQLQRRPLVVAEAAQVDRIPFFARYLHAEEVAKV